MVKIVLVGVITLLFAFAMAAPADDQQRVARLKAAILRYVANEVKNQAAKIRNICPKGLPKQMCKQPPTFYMWLRELRQRMAKKQLERQILTRLLGTFVKISKRNPGFARRLVKAFRKTVFKHAMVTTTPKPTPKPTPKMHPPTPPVLIRMALLNLPNPYMQKAEPSSREREEMLRDSRNTFWAPYRNGSRPISMED